MDRKSSQLLNFRLTPRMIMSCRLLLNVDEAALVLGIPARRVRNLIYEGRFRCTKDRPIRIPADDVAQALIGGEAA